MHPAPSLVEAPPKRDGSHTEGQHVNGDNHDPSRGQQYHVPNGVHGTHAPLAEGNPSPVRKDTTSSTSTTVSAATLATLASSDSTAPAYTTATQGVFSVKDGADVVTQRRPSRRRTGPLSAVQRERAALIRKVGACGDCRRRRVACHPNHHGMSWEDAAKKYRSHSPSVQELAPLTGRPLSPAPLHSRTVFTQDPQEMDIDASPTQQPGRPPLSDSRIRTPLPSAPRADTRPANMVPVTGADAHKAADLQATVSRILANPSRSRYTAVSALLVHWQDDSDPDAKSAIDELGSVLEQHYNYTFQIISIPAPSDGCKNSWRWLSREVTNFVDNLDNRDVLKIVYYSGHSYLDREREMVLASSQNAEPGSAIRWSGIQQILENASSDTLILMDSAYYPSSKLVRQEGVLELIAASASEDHLKLLDRSAFTRAVTDQLRTRASQSFMSPLSATELHTRVLSQYPKMIQDRNPEKETITSFPTPLHLQVSGNSRLPSILLVPMRGGHVPYATPDSPSGGVQVTLTFRLPDEAISTDNWAEWFRWMPEGIRDVKLDGPYRNTFR